jgi:hypothetical protein
MVASPSGSSVLEPGGEGPGEGEANKSLYVDSGGSLRTSAASGSQAVYLRDPIMNDGTVTLGAPLDNQDSGTVSTNKNIWTVSGGSAYSLSGGSGFTQNSGTLTVLGYMADDDGSSPPLAGSSPATT